VLEKFMVPYIERTLALPAEELEKLSKSDKNFTFLHNIARFSRDPKVIRDQIMAVLLAGRDTTAATLSWTIYELSNYPAVLARLRNEILSTVGSSRTPTYEDIKSMTYLTHTLNETLRLYPAVPFNVRAALVDTTLPGRPGQPNIAVLKDDVVAYSAMSMQRRGDIYPPTSEKFADPAIFSPDRWDHWTPKAWHYVPFNGGPRICVGQNFAMTEMAFFCKSCSDMTSKTFMTDPFLLYQWCGSCRSTTDLSTAVTGTHSSTRWRLSAPQDMGCRLLCMRLSTAMWHEHAPGQPMGFGLSRRLPVELRIECCYPHYGFLLLPLYFEKLHALQPSHSVLNTLFTPKDKVGSKGSGR
jgi:hypothetical protein